MAAPAIGIRPRWAPPASTAIDWSAPLAQGLVTLWWPGVRNDPVDGALWTPTAASDTGGRFGYARSITSGGKIVRADPMPLQTGSWMVVQRLTAAPATNGNTYGQDSPTTTKRWGALVPYGDGTIYWDVKDSSAGRLTYAGWTWGNWDVFVFTNGAAGGQSIWGNGLRLANDTVAAARDSIDTTWGWGVGPSVTQTTTTQCSIIAGWKRELSAHEIAQLTIDPFCMLRR